MLDWVLNSVPARRNSSFLNSIRYRFDANNNTVIQQLNFEMFSCTFRMLSQQFGTSLIFIESCFGFLFKVYINQSRIWDTQPTSNMELFVTIGICKVIFSRLVILRTQHCPQQNIFICVSLLMVPFPSKWFQLQTSEMCSLWQLLLML